MQSNGERGDRGWASALGLESFPGDDLDAQVDALVADVDPPGPAISSTKRSL